VLVLGQRLLRIKAPNVTLCIIRFTTSNHSLLNQTDLSGKILAQLMGELELEMMEMKAVMMKDLRSILRYLEARSQMT